MVEKRPTELEVVLRWTEHLHKVGRAHHSLVVSLRGIFLLLLTAITVTLEACATDHPHSAIGFKITGSLDHSLATIATRESIAWSKLYVGSHWSTVRFVSVSFRKFA